MTRKEKERIYVRVSNHTPYVRCLDFSTGYKEINGNQYGFEEVRDYRSEKSWLHLTLILNPSNSLRIECSLTK